MTTKSDLDTLIATPLETVADNGFSRAVAAKIVARDNSVSWFEVGAGIAVVIFVVLFVPVARVTAPFEAIAINLGMSLPFVVACAAIALTHATLRLLPD
jgi:hypothetical protein